SRRRTCGWITSFLKEKGVRTASGGYGSPLGLTGRAFGSQPNGFWQVSSDLPFGRASGLKGC
ncbi:MAG: hypothetical protein WAK24_16255, partial [Candidatus Acidiferrales bacterium]